MSCGNDKPTGYHNGTATENTTWMVPLGDSLNILKSENGLWKLPAAGDSIQTIKSYTYFRKPLITKYNKLLGKVDQERVNSSDTNIVQFYRFDDKGLLLVGYTNKDTTKPLTIFDPPMRIQPAELNEKIVSHSLMKTWSGNKFDEGLKTTVTITPEEKGKYVDSLGNDKTATLYSLTITRDATIQYADNNLIVPGAVYLNSNILAGDNGELLLEWGIRSIHRDKTEEKTTAHDSLYIEVTAYKRLINFNKANRSN